MLTWRIYMRFKCRIHVLPSILRQHRPRSTPANRVLVMSTTTLTADTITTAGLVEDTVQFSHSTRSPGRNNAGTNVTATAPKAPAQQPPTPTTTVPTPPASRPLTPSTPAGTLSSPPSSPTKPEINPSARSKWLNHLSHISIATWIGVGLALGGLVVTIYYGIPIMRLAVWTHRTTSAKPARAN